jgi:hypothetical protein
MSPRLLLALLGAALLSIATGCQAVAVKRAAAVPFRPEHDIVISLTDGAAGPAAVALSGQRLAAIWPTRRSGVLSVAFTSFSRPDGPCGRPGPASIVERGRPDTPVACFLSSSSNWARRTLRAPKARAISGAFSARRLDVVVAHDGTLTHSALSLPGLRVLYRTMWREPGVASVDVVETPTSVLVASAARTPGGQAVHVWLVGKGRATLVRTIRTDVGPVAFARRGDGYALAVNKAGSLHVFAARTPRAPLVALRFGGPAASSVALRDGGRSTIVAFQVRDPRGRNVVVSALTDAGVLARGPAGDVTSVLAALANGVVVEASRRSRGAVATGYMTLRVSGASRRFDPVGFPTYPATAAASSGGSVALIGARSSPGSPIQSYQLSVITP